MTSMTEDQTYNGWKNYPTWDVHLWLTNEDGLYHEALSIVSEAHAEAGTNESRRVNAADRLKNFVEEMGVTVVNRYAGDTATGDPQGFGADLYGWALSQVDWFEVADALWNSNV